MGGYLICRVPTEPEAMGHVAAPEPTSVGRRGPELSNTWQRRSSTQQAGDARGHGTHGSTGAHLGGKARSGAAEHVKVPELTSIGRRGPELQGTWQRIDARHALCLDLKLVCGGTRSAWYRQRPRAHLESGSELSYPVFTPKPSTHRMHDPGSIVPHIRLKVLTDNQMS
jgi:hypothetical protein